MAPRKKKSSTPKANAGKSAEIESTVKPTVCEPPKPCPEPKPEPVIEDLPDESPKDAWDYVQKHHLLWALIGIFWLAVLAFAVAYHYHDRRDYWAGTAFYEQGVFKKHIECMKSGSHDCMGVAPAPLDPNQ